MSLLDTINYDDISNFNTDISKIEIPVDSAKLILSQHTVDFPLPFDSDAGYTYDSSLAEFVAGVLRQKDKSQTGSLCSATFTSSINLSTYNGSNLGTAYNGAAIVSNKLDIIGAIRYVKYNALSNANFTQTGTIKFKLTTTYSGNPVNNSYMYALGLESGTENQLYFYHSNTGRLYFIAYDSLGNPILNTFFDTWSPISGTTYEIELNMNFTTGNHMLFINGTQKSTTKTGSGTRTNTATKLIIGAGITGLSGIDAYIEDLVIFDTVQHTANYTSGYTLSESKYAENVVESPELAHTGLGTLISLDQFTTIDTNDPRFSLQIGRSGDYLYWDGSVWDVSDGTYAQANTAAVFNAHIDELDVDGEIYGQFKIHFNGSNTQQSISSLIAELTENNGYYIDNPTIARKAKTDSDGLIEFTETATKPVGTEVKYNIYISGLYKWFSGTSWEVTTGSDYSKSNTIEELNDNIDSLDIASGAEITLVAFLHSDDGTATPELEQNTMEYDFYQPPLDEIRECIVYGELSDILGDKDSTDAALIIENEELFFHTGHTIRKSVKRTEVQEGGKFEISVIETTTINQKVKISIEYKDDEGETITTELGKVLIPSQDKVNISDLF